MGVEIKSEEQADWKPLRPAFCKLLDFPEHYSWEAIYEEVKLMKRRLSQMSADVRRGSNTMSTTTAKVNKLGQWIHHINPTKIKKGQEPKHMPAGTVLTLTRLPDGSWRGYCVCNGLACERKSKGLMGLTIALCRAWLKEAGIVTAKPSETDNG